MNFVLGFETVEVFAVIEIPEHGCAVFAPRSTEGTVRGDGDGVNVAGVTEVVCAEFTFRQFPDLAVNKLFRQQRTKVVLCVGGAIR